MNSNRDNEPHTADRVATGSRLTSRLTSRLLPQLAVELLIGLGVAVLLVIVAWASSNAIRFVYGGY